MLSFLMGQRGSESVGWAPWEGQRWLCRPGTKEGEQKGLQGRNSQSHSPPASALHFAFICCQPGMSLLNQEWPKSHRKVAPPGAFIARNPPGWSSAPLPSSWGQEPFSILPGWAFPSTDAQCSRPRVHGHAVGQGGWRRGVSQCTSFLEGMLSKKCAEKCFGKWFGGITLSFSMINNGDGGKRSK